jgi:signal recognition particle subunit SRP54
MMVGLQGQGKTTTSAKLARLLAKQGKKVLLVAADLQRPAAVEQLQVLGQKVDVPVFAVAGSTPVEVCKRALAVARVQKKDVVIFDTAGRLAIDTPLMEELARSSPSRSRRTSSSWSTRPSGRTRSPRRRPSTTPSGSRAWLLTMLDGDARGGAALSIREVTGVPIRFAGTGEADGPPRALSPRRHGVAHPRDGRHRRHGQRLHRGGRPEAGRAGREADAPGPTSTFDDFVEQIDTIQKMGPLQELFEKMPFFADDDAPGREGRRHASSTG